MYSSKKRIIVNTVATYTRTILAVFLVLFSSRWVLSELGISDFGLFSLIGSVLVFISFLNTVLANGDARFFSIMIGKNDKEGMRTLFSSSLVLHILLLPFLIFMGWILGELAIRYFLDIPSNRLLAALTIFYISLVTTLFNMFAVSFRALFIAHQNIVSSTFLDLLQTLLLFIVAYSLKFYEGDKLIFYTLMYCIVQVGICLAFVIYGKYKYSYCVYIRKQYINKNFIYSLLKYSFWNALGDIGHLIRTQGTAVVVNLLFGTYGNAALGIANQVSMQASGLSNSLLNATSPEIYRRVGFGNINSAMSLSVMLNKVAVLLILILALPLIVYMDEILELWLVEVPAYTSELCICFILMYIMERYTTGHLVMMKAVNYISKVQTSIFICYSMSVIFPFLGLCYYWGIIGIGISCVLSMFLSRIFIIFIYKIKFKTSLSDYLIHFVFVSLLIVIFIILTFRLLIPNHPIGLVNILWTSGVLVLVVLTLYIFFIFNKSERLSLFNVIKRKF